MRSMNALELPDDIAASVRHALVEDMGSGDLTAALIEPHMRARAQVVSREPAVLCGCAWFDEVFRQLDPAIHVVWQAHDGDAVQADQLLCRLTGPARPLLSGERTALNFLQTLSGTATVARRYAEAVHGTHATILDTRKTLPGLRHAQKYAVRCGGAGNHRIGLYDGILVKENHIMAAGSIAAAVTAARRQSTAIKVEVEVENLDELREALAAGADIALLDDFTLPQLREAVRLNAGRMKLEASGSVDLDSVRAVAETGVDYISVGALTKHVRAVDLSMRFELNAAGG
ncbi:MAG TPA: carboxylating nicotinate-nucleotide diphosphorylase [Gammaproteobacteria bacterium]|nr:carboxylating nicotinate-nucleotide diphosphorylase [Gammaproteobacteria bacterium]